MGLVRKLAPARLIHTATANVLQLLTIVQATHPYLEPEEA